MPWPRSPQLASPSSRLPPAWAHENAPVSNPSTGRPAAPVRLCLALDLVPAVMSAGILHAACMRSGCLLVAAASSTPRTAARSGAPQAERLTGCLARRNVGGLGDEALAGRLYPMRNLQNAYDEVSTRNVERACFCCPYTARAPRLRCHDSRFWTKPYIRKPAQKPRVRDLLLERHHTRGYSTLTLFFVAITGRVMACSAITIMQMPQTSIPPRSPCQGPPEEAPAVPSQPCC